MPGNPLKRVGQPRVAHRHRRMLDRRGQRHPVGKVQLLGQGIVDQGCHLVGDDRGGEEVERDAFGREPNRRRDQLCPCLSSL
jgi:hypothetical protein